MRRGEDEPLPRDQHGRSLNTFSNVYREMLVQVLLDYQGGAGDFRRLTRDEIRFLYNGIRYQLKRLTKPK